MDPETKKITDPRRVLWTDETPQFIDYNAADRRDEAAKKKRARDDAGASLQAAWELCGAGCACGLGDDCPMKGLKRCERCGDIKKTVCRKRVCTEPAAPLLLTCNVAP